MRKRVCILGLGATGAAAARHALACGDDVTVYAGAGTERTRAAAREFAEAGVPVHFDTEDVAGPFDLCIASPGIPQTGAFYQSALCASAELVSEPEYAWRLSPQQWVAITGTNGKTTTTSMVEHVLNGCGISAAACGNIGKTALSAVEERGSSQVLVAELSSYQIASMRDFAPVVGVLLNITPDHLSWHGSFEAYAQAKYSLFARMGQGSTAVLVEGTPGIGEVAEGLRSRGARVVVVGREAPGDCAFADEHGMLHVEFGGVDETLCAAGDLQVKGDHNVVNALAAACVARALGCSAEGIADALKGFGALEHRIEPCGTVGGVAFYNDSKGTNVDATLKALSAFPAGSVVLLCGGTDKNTALDALVGACAGACSHVVCYGEAGPRFFAEFSAAGVNCSLETGMRDAFEAACGAARSGQTVLLSPACASFDEFSSFEERGRAFKGLVAEHAAGRGRAR